MIMERSRNLNYFDTEIQMVDPINGLSDDECNISIGYFSRLGNHKDHVQVYDLYKEHVQHQELLDVEKMVSNQFQKDTGLRVKDVSDAILIDEKYELSRI
jgi:hypothetical protein